MIPGLGKLEGSPAARLADDPGGCRVFTISGSASSQLPLRWLGPFAQRDLLPEEIHIRREGDRITATIVQFTLDAHGAEIIAAKLLALPETEAVHLG